MENFASPDYTITARRIITAFAVAGAFIGLLAGPLFAQGAPSTGTSETLAVEPVEEEGRVAIGEELILRVRYPATGMSIKDRADTITDRIHALITPDVTPADITVAASGQEAKILVKNQLLVTVDTETARYNHAKPLTLARFWADHVRRVIPRIVPKLGKEPATQEYLKENGEGDGKPQGKR